MVHVDSQTSCSFLSFAPKCKIGLFTRAAALTALIIGIAPISRSSVIVTNLTEPAAGTFANDLHTNDAQSFTVPIGATETLQDVIVELFGNGITASFSLYSDSGAGHPFNALGRIGPTGIVTPTGSSYATYTIAGTKTLDPGQTYWLVNSYDGDPNWAYTSSTSYTGTGTIGKSEYSLNGGATWQINSNGPFLFRIDATTVPEPTTILLSLIPFAALGILKLRTDLIRRRTARLPA